jgi:putative membrane protein
LLFDWQFEPDIVILTLIACAIYAAGMLRRPNADHLRQWRHAAYFGGVALVFLALESPIDELSDHLFWMHQIQHMLLRMAAPMLIAVSAPQAMLIAGLPGPLRRGALTPFMTTPALRGIFSFLTNTIVVTLLFIAALYVWQYPPFHNSAIVNDRVHYAMHMTMLAAGLLFWWRIFDLRPPPMGISHGTRLMMLLIVSLTQIGLGAYTSLKSEVLYPAYDTVGRLFGIKPLTDEMIGGFVLWAPSSMMCLLAALFVIHLLGRQEARSDERHAALHPATGAELVARARSKNVMVAVGVTALVVLLFGGAILVGVLDHLNNETPHGLFAHAAAVGKIR